MSTELNVFLSNRLEVLYQHLKNALFNPNIPPLMRRLVVVYGPAMKSWLMLKMSQDPDLSIATGVEFITLSQAFDLLLHLTSPQNTDHLPTLLELSLAIEKELMLVIQHYPSLPPNIQSEWAPVIHYLKLDSQQMQTSFCLSRKMERRLIALSDQVARQFQEYGRYAEKIVAQWESREASGWQQRLWQKIFGKKSGWTYPSRALQTCNSPSSSFALHFFSISFVTASEFTFLRQLSTHISVNYYLLSPCAVFWSDIRSDRESAYLQSHWQKKLGTDSPHLLQLEEMLRDRNPLLANFGRLGREMACQVEESQAQTTALYVLSEAAEALDDEALANDDLYLEETESPLSLLHALQTDLLLMRNPQGKPSFDLTENCGSIQLHSAPNLRREIEILYHNLLGLMDKDPSLCPEDIIVMAPQIADYVPYIQTQFGSRSSQIDFQILDLGMQMQCEIVQGFLQLVKLSESRWDSNQLLQLFEHRSFQRRHQLTASDYLTIQGWVEQAGILWGDDWLHRNELLLRSHCVEGMADESAVGTWDFGLSRLLFGLTTLANPDYSQNTDNPLPCSIVDFSQTELMGKWIRILHSLRDDLTPLQDRSQLTMEDWAKFLKCLLDSYFRPDINDSQSVDEYEDFKAQFEVLNSSAQFFKEARYPFASVKFHLLSLLQQRGVTYRENQIQSVRFCSLVPLRSIPAKVIALLGMQEGAFPRISHHSSLNLMTEMKEADYCPQSTDYDRYLFLEAMHSAREVLLISYQGYHHKDNKELQPALVVDELFSYLDKYYTIQGEKISKCCVLKHPFDSFDTEYFKKDSPFNNFSQEDFRAAQSLNQKEKKGPYRFIQDFFFKDHPLPEIIPSGTVIDLKDLAAVARNPIKFHLNKKYEIYLQNDEDRKIKKEEELSLSSLDHYLLKQHILNTPVDAILNLAEKEGKFPLGLFKTVAVNKLKKEFSKVHKELEEYAIDPNEIFQIEFSTGCLEPTQVEDHRWLFPPIVLDYEDGYQLSLVGKISHATPNGLLILSKGGISDTWKAWPQYLMYCYAATIKPDWMNPQLIFAEAQKALPSFIADPIPYLKQFVNYFALCHHQFSPLLSDWISLILKGDTPGLQNKLQQLYSDYGDNYHNQNVRWILNKQALPSAETIIDEWKERAELLIGEMIRVWYPSESAVVEVEA